MSNARVQKESEPLRASIDFRELLKLQAVANAARRWVPFQEMDSLSDQRTDTRLRMQAADAAIELCNAVALLEGK